MNFRHIFNKILKTRIPECPKTRKPEGFLLKPDKNPKIITWTRPEPEKWYPNPIFATRLHHYLIVQTATTQPISKILLRIHTYRYSRLWRNPPLWQLFGICWMPLEKSIFQPHTDRCSTDQLSSLMDQNQKTWKNHKIDFTEKILFSRHEIIIRKVLEVNFYLHRNIWRLGRQLIEKNLSQ